MTAAHHAADPLRFAELTCKRLFYPCAGEDWAPVLDYFVAEVDHFIFADLHYQFDRIRPMDVPGLRLLPERTWLDGRAFAALERPSAYGRRGPRQIDPARLEETYLHEASGRLIRVTRRRGFAQYALKEIPNGSLGVFFHRGDSMGEGGSDAWFLANRPRRHPPLSNLFARLKQKLAYPALIASDGSNTTFEPLITAVRSDAQQPVQFELEGLHWARVGTMTDEGRRRTAIWRVMPLY